MTMQRINNAAIAAFTLLFAGCASFQANTELHKGRQALRQGMPDAAIAHLEQATAINGGLIASNFHDSPWTYLSRAYYEARSYADARRAAERALEINSSDSLARFYLGLSLTRQGEHEPSRKEVLAGLEGLNQTIEYIVYNTRSGPYWDPAGRIRTDLAGARSAVMAANPHLESLLPRLDGIAAAIAEEMVQARRDESRAIRRRSRD
jgi:tetratricopeptide (TPR) repeat protein